MKAKRNGLILCSIFFISLISFSSSFGATGTYTYDNLNRLTKVTYGNGIIEEFAYDGVGNRLSYEIKGPATATPTPATNVTSNLATLNGTVNPNGLASTYYFEWGTTASYGNTTSSQSAGSDWNAVAISANLNGLTPNATYHYRLVAINSAGIAYGSDMTFTTSSVPPNATTRPATSVTANSAELNGTVNANNASTTVTFQYGLTTAYGTTVNATQSPVTGSSITSVSKAIIGLTPNTTYHYRVVGVNAGGTANGGDLTFKTPAAAPTATTIGAGVTATGATLNGTVNPNGSPTICYFEWGSTTAYGQATIFLSAGNGTSNVLVSTPLTGLTRNATYHYRIVATNSLGTTYGADMTFYATVNPLPWLRLLLENENHIGP